MRTPGQAQPVALALDGREEASGSAEDRPWSFVLTPREAAAPGRARLLALSRLQAPSAMEGGGPTLTGRPRARC